jgi:hypothetical protein
VKAPLPDRNARHRLMVTGASRSPRRSSGQAVALGELVFDAHPEKDVLVAGEGADLAGNPTTTASPPPPPGPTLFPPTPSLDPLTTWPSIPRSSTATSPSQRPSDSCQPWGRALPGPAPLRSGGAGC